MTPSQRRRPPQSAGPPSQEPRPSLSQGPSQSQSQSAAAGSPSSGPGSPAAEFIADPGPAFDPEHAPAPPAATDLAPEPAVEDEGWDEARVRELLELQGEATHAALAVGPDDETTWIHTERDLRAIAPPLTRILNRYDVTRAAAAAGDEFLLAAAVGRYGIRNFKARRRLLAHQAAQGPQPVTGVSAPEGTGPDDDEEWARVHELPLDPPPDLTPKGARR